MSDILDNLVVVFFFLGGGIFSCFSGIFIML